VIEDKELRVTKFGWKDSFIKLLWEFRVGVAKRYHRYEITLGTERQQVDLIF
jgi:hypothetical protein